MEKRMGAFALILVGAIPVALYIFLRIISGTDYVITINNSAFVSWFQEYGSITVFFGFLGGVTLIVLGMYKLGKIKITELSELDDREMSPDERIVLKQSARNSILTVTNKRVRYYGVYTKNLRKNIDNLPASDKEDFLISSIASVRAVNAAAVNKNVFAKMGNVKWGIQLSLKNGSLINIPINNHEEVAKQIQSLIQST